MVFEDDQSHVIDLVILWDVLFTVDKSLKVSWGGHQIINSKPTKLFVHYKSIHILWFCFLFACNDRQLLFVTV